MQAAPGQPQKSGMGAGTAAALGVGGGLLGGALLANAFEGGDDVDAYREGMADGYNDGYGDGFGDGFDDGADF